MRIDIVLTLTGPDRVGIVEEVTGAVLDLGGNVGTSSMARLGGEFAMLMMVAIADEKEGELQTALGGLKAQGYDVRIGRVSVEAEPPAAAGLPFRIDVRGADHEGIVHEIARGLARRGINIEAMETGVSSAPMSGAPLFWLTARVAVPAEVAESAWIREVRDAGRAAGVDVTIATAD